MHRGTVFLLCLVAALLAFPQCIHGWGSAVEWATGPNNGRKIVVDNDGRSHIVYQSTWDWTPPFYDVAIVYRKDGNPPVTFQGYYYPSLAVSPDGTPYITALYTSDYQYNEQLRVLDGGNNWQSWLIRADLRESIWYPSIVHDGSSHYVAWHHTNFPYWSWIRYADTEDGQNWFWNVHESKHWDGAKYASIALDAEGTPNILSMYDEAAEYPSLAPDHEIWHAVGTDDDFTKLHVWDGYEDQAHPCADLNQYDERIHGVWEDNGSISPTSGMILHRYYDEENTRWWPATPLVVNSNNTVDAQYPVIDDYYAVWTETAGPSSQVWYAYYALWLPGWYGHTRLSDAGKVARYPQVAFEHTSGPTVEDDTLHIVWTEEIGPASYDVVYTKLPVEDVNPQLSYARGASVRDLSVSGAPNPFRTSTTLNLQVPQPMMVSVQVYDIAGRIVKTISYDPLAKGSHDFVWDGNDNAGNPVPSGTYVCRAECGNEVKSVRLSLVR